MTDENTAGPDAEGVDWGDVQAPTNEAPPGAYDSTTPATYPEYSDNPHHHRYTISLVPDKAPMIVVRGQTAAEITAALNELEAYGVYANIGAAYASLKTQGNLGGGLGPVTPVAPQAPPPGLPPAPVPAGPQTPQTPPPFGPNVSVPQAPGYQGPSAPVAPQAPPGGGWGGSGGGGKTQPSPNPGGWYKVNARSGPGFDHFKALRGQGTETGNYLRGKVKWAGGPEYWVEPSVAQWVAQQGYPVTQ